MKKEAADAIDATMAAVGTKATYAGAGVSGLGWFLSNEFFGLAGVNVLIPPLDGTIGYADETLSARCYRAHRDGKVFGKLLMRPIDLLFFWQGPDHCRNAYIKEFERKNYPSEYHGGVPIFESRTAKK